VNQRHIHYSSFIGVFPFFSALLFYDTFQHSVCLLSQLGVFVLITTGYCLGGSNPNFQDKTRRGPHVAGVQTQRSSHEQGGGDITSFML
jgi:hypothetical protein